MRNEQEFNEFQEAENIDLNEFMANSEDNPNDEITETISNRDSELSQNKNNIIQVLDVWKDQCRNDENKKTKIFNFIRNIIIAQLLFLAVYILLHAFNKITVEEWTFRIIVVSIFGVSIGIFTIIVNNLFPPNGNEAFLDFIKTIYVENNKSNNNQE